LNQKIIEYIGNCKTCSTKNIRNIADIHKGLCKNCSVMLIAYNRYFESNIPVDYWDLDMPDSLTGDRKSFSGSEELLKIYLSITNDIGKIYSTGKSACLAGKNGTGKTLTLSNVLKKAAQKNYGCLYTTLSDIVAVLTDAPHEEKFIARQELMLQDFLVIDEFDPRYSPTEISADLFGRTLEHVIRTRIQNGLPTFLCTNSPNPIETFNGAVKQALESLMARIKIIPVFGKDFRKEQGVK